MLLPIALLSIVLQQPSAAPARPDADSLRQVARQIEAVYERRIRRYAPLSTSRGSSGRCDERVGRYCLSFDDPSEPEEPIPPDHEAVVAARRAAVRALRRAFAAAPADDYVAGSLVRYLVEDGRTAEAVSAARAHLSLAPDTARASLLLGFALHHDGRIAAAEAEFRRGLWALQRTERNSLLDLDVLLSGEESERYERLDASERAAYADRVWALADPLYLVEGNGALTEHLARHVWTNLLPRAPWVRGKVSWGADLTELTLRYGVPVSKERVRGSAYAGDHFIERFDPAEVAVVPAEISEPGSLEAPAPGEAGALDPLRPRSAHTPRDVRRLIDIAHQAIVVPLGADSAEIRVAAELPLDSLAERPVRVRAGLFLRSADSLDPIAHVLDEFAVDGDTARWLGRVRVPAGRYIYSVELLEEGSRLSGRARYLLSSAAMPGGNVACGVSDVILTHAIGARTVDDPVSRPVPLAGATFVAGDTIGVVAEIAECALSRGSLVRIALAVEPAEAAPAPLRAIRWIGRALGLVDEASAPRLAWEQTIGEEAGDGQDVAVDLVLADFDPGLYAIVLRLDGPAGGVERRRLIRIVGRGG